MNEPSNIVKTIIIYAICVPLAIFIGFQITAPMTYSAFGWTGGLLFICAFPLLFRYHQLLLITSINAIAVIFFIPGRPDIWMVMTVMSLGISILQRALNKHLKFLYVPEITWPLVAMLAVVLVTAQLTGGIGLRALGGSVYGGRRYLTLICGILIYFALTARRIPPDKVRLYTILFFMSGATCIIGDLISLMAPSMYFIFWIFPPNVGSADGLDLGTARLAGAGGVGTAIFTYLMARYGVREVFVRYTSRVYIGIALLGSLGCIALAIHSLNPAYLVGIIPLCLFFFYGRVALLGVAIVFAMLGGFRAQIILFSLIMSVLFFLERLHRTKMMPRALSLVGVVCVSLIMFSSHLPFTFQRSLTFLPLKLDPQAKSDAEGSKEWRVKMWKAVWPQVPQYLLLGKGFSISSLDFDTLAGSSLGASENFEENSSTAMAGDYHNGPLSVLLPFGVWGCGAFLWLLFAGGRVVYFNFRYGPPELKIFNTYIFAAFFARTFMFMFIFGSFAYDMCQYATLLGLSISLNGGVCRTKQSKIKEVAPRGAFINILRRPRPAFQP